MPFDRTNTGSFSANKKKRPEKNDADITGSINVEGTEYFIDGWKKENEKGIWYSLKIKRKGQSGSSQPQQSTRTTPPRRPPPPPPAQKPQPSDPPPEGKDFDPATGEYRF